MSIVFTEKVMQQQCPFHTDFMKLHLGMAKLLALRRQLLGAFSQATVVSYVRVSKFLFFFQFQILGDTYSQCILVMNVQFNMCLK